MGVCIKYFIRKERKLKFKRIKRMAELPTVTTSQPHLAKQDLTGLDIGKLTPLSPEVISRQATINIGTIGHVAHGKSTVVKALSGVHTVRFKYSLVRHVSFVDCPGHDILMATMLNGAAVMDAALLLIAGNEPCPQPQTSEHLAAIEIMKLKHILILQNKIDLIKEEQAKQQQQEILSFIEGTVAEGAPIVPISAQLKYNIEVVCEYIEK